MSDFRVVEYSEDRIDAVRALWREQFDEDSVPKREALFRWLSEGNPFLEGRAPYYLLMDGERVVGMHGHMPLRFSVQGKVELGYLAHDDLLSVDYRGKGLGKIMLNGVVSKVPVLAGSLWHNEGNRRLYEKAGWVGVPGFVPQLKIFDPMVFAEGRLGNGVLARIASSALKTGLRLWDLRLRHRSAVAVRIEPVERFDDRFDRFFDSISDQLGISVVRNAAYLNWKFVEKPFNAYRRWAAFDSEGNLAGYTVAKTEPVDGYSRGLIVDVLADPRRPEVFAELIRACTRELADEGVSYLSLLCTHPSFTAPLRKLGFVHARHALNFMVINWKERFEQEFIGRIDSWYLTHGDADGDAWIVDVH